MGLLLGRRWFPSLGLDMPDYSRFAIEAIACVGASVMAEANRPSQTWRGSVVNIGLGIAGGAYGPQGVEVYVESAKRMHLLVTFVCGWLGATIFKKLLEYVSSLSPSDIATFFGRIIDAARKPKGKRP